MLTTFDPVKSPLINRKPLSLGNRATALLLTLLLLMAGLMASVHEGHHKLHAQHEGAGMCLACALSKGQCQVPTVAQNLVCVDFPSILVPVKPFAEPVAGPACALLACRAPPLS